MSLLSKAVRGFATAGAGIATDRLAELREMRYMEAQQAYRKAEIADDRQYQEKITAQQNEREDKRYNEELARADAAAQAAGAANAEKEAYSRKKDAADMKYKYDELDARVKAASARSGGGSGSATQEQKNYEFLVSNNYSKEDAQRIAFNKGTDIIGEINRVAKLYLPDTNGMPPKPEDVDAALKKATDYVMGKIPKPQQKTEPQQQSESPAQINPLIKKPAPKVSINNW